MYRKTPEQEFQTCKFIKKRLRHGIFALNFAKWLRTYCFVEHLGVAVLVAQYICDTVGIWVFSSNSQFTIIHCVKIVQIRSYFWSEYRKIRPRNNSVSGYFSRGDNAPKQRFVNTHKCIRILRNTTNTWLNFQKCNHTY